MTNVGHHEEVATCIAKLFTGTVEIKGFFGARPKHYKSPNCPRDRPPPDSPREGAGVNYPPPATMVGLDACMDPFRCKTRGFHQRKNVWALDAANIASTLAEPRGQTKQAFRHFMNFSLPSCVLCLGPQLWIAKQAGQQKRIVLRCFYSPSAGRILILANEEAWKGNCFNHFFRFPPSHWGHRQFPKHLVQSTL